MCDEKYFQNNNLNENELFDLLGAQKLNFERIEKYLKVGQS
jgi:hypothetical protein